MVKPSCHTCVYAFWNRGLWLRTLWSGFPSRPFCANHPDSPGRTREVPLGGACRNYRARPATPDLTDGTVKRIPVAGGLYAYVDAADYDLISRHNWRLVSGGYAGRYERGKLILMHRQIMNPAEGMVVDHIQGNRMDNTRANLRVCTLAQNNRNRTKHKGAPSRFIGVYYNKQRGKWQALIRVDGKYKCVGSFDDEIEAARAYDHRAVELYGEFARLNFPDEWPAERRQALHAAPKTEREKVRTKEAGKVTHTAKRRTNPAKRPATRDTRRGTRAGRPKARR